jgi:hypothetical protein
MNHLRLKASPGSQARGPFASPEGPVLPPRPARRVRFPEGAVFHFRNNGFRGGLVVARRRC